jgi:hypothetical protein
MLVESCMPDDVFISRYVMMGINFWQARYAHRHRGAMGVAGQISRRYNIKPHVGFFFWVAYDLDSNVIASGMTFNLTQAKGSISREIQELFRP